MKMISVDEMNLTLDGALETARKGNPDAVYGLFVAKAELELVSCVEADRVRKGKWEHFRCSECGNPFRELIKFPYCPWCGAKMENGSRVVQNENKKEGKHLMLDISGCGGQNEYDQK